MASDYISQRLIRVKPQGYVFPAFVQSEASTHPDVLPAYVPPSCDQAHPVQLGQPTLFTEEKTLGLLSYVSISRQHCRKLSVLGQVGLTG